MQKRKRPTILERLTGSVPMPQEEVIIKPKHEEEESISPQIQEREDEEGELAIDMFETPTELIIKTMVAGVRPEDLTVSISREMVIIRGKRAAEHETYAGSFFSQELYWGSFSRTIMLPQEVEADEAEAVEKHGLLTIRLPKLNKEKTAHLKVRSL